MSTANSHLSALETALSYIAQDWPVFPCRPQEEVDEWGEIHAAKTPLVSNGLRGASLNERIVREWWRRMPDAMVAVPTGRKIGAFVLDVDNKPGGSNGFEWLDEMESAHGQLPPTRRAKTANGGMHIFFRYVEGTRNRGALGDGVDIRSEGGYVVAAGSRMSDGRSYEWEDAEAPIADAPEWLLDLLLPKAAPTHVQVPSYSGNDRYVERAVQDELDDLAAEPMGNRNNALNDASFALGTFVGAGALSESEARALLEDVARSWGRDWSRCVKTINNGLAAGIRNPRHIPEPEFQQQDNTRLVDISRMIENGLKKARKEADKEVDTASTKADVKPDNAQDTGQNEPVRKEDSPAGSHAVSPAVAHAVSPTDTPAILATPFEWIDPTKLPRREFAFGTHYIRKYVSVTGAPGGLGKSSNSIVDALSMVSGRALAGTKPPLRLKVWLFNMEDPRDELERRIMAAAVHYNLKPDDLRGLFVDTGREQELVIAREDKRSGVKVIEPIVEAVTEQIRANEIDVMIVDPFVSTHAVNENDNGAIDKVAKLWALIADKTNCSIDVVHHLRKVSDREATVEDMRGAVALIGAARSVRVLNRMTEDQATQAAVADRFGYFSITYGKSNLTPLSHRLDWRYLESVPLGNGRGLTKPQDHAPVVTEWKWPTSEEVSGALTGEQKAHIKTLLDNGSYKEGARAKNWAGQAVAYALGLDLEEDTAKRRATTVLKAMMQEGELVKSEEKDPVRREQAVFIRSNDWAA